MPAFIALLLTVFLSASAVLHAAEAQTADLRSLVDALGQGSFSDTEKQITAIAATGDPTVAPVLEALGDG
ncbi:MAG: urea ABC transporter permease subunit UrtB, partial [Bauldia sp.]|nr:urea ABC transporter permease subunit UrtB [Bauldia sp.]